MDASAAEARRQRLLAKKKEREVKILNNNREERIPAALLGFQKHENSEINNNTEGKIDVNITQGEKEPKQEEKTVKNEEQIPLKAKESEYIIQLRKEVKKDDSKFTRTKTQEERRNDGYTNLAPSSKKQKKYTPA